MIKTDKRKFSMSKRASVLHGKKQNKVEEETTSKKFFLLPTKEHGEQIINEAKSSFVEIKNRIKKRIAEKLKEISILLSYLVAIYIIVYVLLTKQSFLGLFTIAPLSNDIFTYALVAVLTFFLSRHIIQIKLVLYRIFLQTFLDIESSTYKFLSHGFIVRIIAIFVAFALSVNILTFLALTKVHQAQYVFLCLAITVYEIYYKYKKTYSGHSFIRKDVNSILKSYLIPFMIASIAAVGVSTYELLTMEPVVIRDMNQVLKMTMAAIDNESISWPLRVIVRHMYGYELSITQVINLPIFGKSIYFIYSLLSEGAMTYFSMLMLIMPYRRNEQ